MSRAFAKYNRNGDGLLDLDELRGLLDDANYHVDASYVNGLADMFGKWDTDGSGGIELSEFRTLWAQLDLGGMLQEAVAAGRAGASSSRSAAEVPVGDEVAAAFVKYNRNGDGMLDLDEIRVLLEDAKFVVDASYVNGIADMFGKWDTDGSGGVELAEFRELWTQLDLGGKLRAAGASGEPRGVAP